MKRSIVMCTVLYLVINNALDVNSMRLKEPNRLKREDISGEGDPTECEQNPVPEPGQRISEQKCEEYKGIINRNRCHSGHKYDGAIAAEYPNLAAIGFEDKNVWKTRCGGSLISSKYVLVAAHCFSPESASNKPLVIRFGDKNLLDENVVEAKIKRTFLHPEFTASKKYNDIALLELEEEITFNENVFPACLWKEEDVSSLGKFANVTGWSQVKPDEVETTAHPKRASVKIVDKATCEERLAPVCSGKCSIKETQICTENFFAALAKTGQWEEGNQCWGYSGDPLQVRISSSSSGSLNYVIGVSSFGARCASDTVPDVYTKVSSYLNWIESIVWS
ncbi:serine protease snake-like [Pectinophora gossypiella]|uniref:Peptidase S1 domain-containing protein n=1 Tax=Pectinophora gossypiella TaxID=13191 RepID=A0A1E1WVA2_PECGO|nr:serine protease snake-like [Pectinophora gossypiella]